MSAGLSFERASVRYRSREALALGAHVFPAGQITALLGANGSGKSSLLRALIGAPPGRVERLTLAGTPAAELSRKERARRLAFLSQDRTGPGLARVRDVLALGRHAHRGTDSDGRVDAVAERLALAPLLERRFGELSGGQQARVLLGRALCVDAPVLLADEPTASLDAAHALRIMAELRAEARSGRTVIVSLHDLALARRFADRALVLKGGRAIAEGPMPAVLDAAVLRESFGLRAGPDGYEATE